MTRRREPYVWPRMLDKGRAAEYCGVCPAVFDQVCGVAPVEIKRGLRRWDRWKLDDWLSARGEAGARDELDGLYEKKEKAA